MKKGVVLSVNKFSITLLTPDGEFEKCRRLQRNYEIGEEIRYQPQESVWNSFFSFSGKKAAVMSAAVACLMLFSIVIPNFSTEVSAYMTIDVNPSIELGVDDDLQVVELRGINADGKRVISNISDWKHKDLADIAKQIVHKTEELGYFKDSNRKIIVSNTVIEDNKTLEKQLSQEMKGFTNDIPSNTVVKTIRATEKDRNQAEQQGISTGKFLEQKHEKDKSKHKRSHMNKKNDREHTDPEHKVSNKEHVEKRNHSKQSEPKKAKTTDLYQPIKGNEIESKKITNGNGKSNPGHKEKSKIKGNKEDKKNTVTKSNQSNQGKSGDKEKSGNKDNTKDKEKSGNKDNSKDKGKSGNNGNSEDKGKSGNKDNSKDKGKSGNKDNSEDKGKSGNNGNSRDKDKAGNNGKSEDKNKAGNNGNSGDKDKAGNNGKSGDKDKSGNNGNSGDKGKSGNNGKSQDKDKAGNNGKSEDKDKSGNNGNSGDKDKSGNNGNSGKNGNSL